MKKSDLVIEWLDYSKKDLDSAKFLRAMVPQPFEIICFHCQQSVEKALKALLYNGNIRPPKTHDIDELISLCGLSEIEKYRVMVLPLNDYSVAVRYPTNLEIEEQDVQQAIDAAEKLYSVVTELV